VTKVLILGGTGEARALAAALVGRGLDVVTSLAGVTMDPVLPPGGIRRGGFGGVEGLAGYLAEADIGIVVDATHPFAAVISRHAGEAAALGGIEYLRLERPAWRAGPGDRWQEVADVPAAAAALPGESTAFVTVGRKDLLAFTARNNVRVIARAIEPPGFELPADWKLVLARPPFTLEAEVALMRDEGVSVLVSKNAGGAATRAKLDAARTLGLPVIMVARPAKPAGETAATVEEMVERVMRSALLSARPREGGSSSS
jgi:precorrin-6A/cobalt-precorrin-6A reductase